MNFRQLKILWLKTGPLHPLDTGGKIRTYNMLKELKKKHHITYIALAPLETKDENKQKQLSIAKKQFGFHGKKRARTIISFI